MLYGRDDVGPVEHKIRLSSRWTVAGAVPPGRSIILLRVIDDPLCSTASEQVGARRVGLFIGG